MGKATLLAAQNDPRFSHITPLSRSTPPPPNCFQNNPILIDFSLPEALDSLLLLATTHSLPLAIGTTGYSADQFAEIENAASRIPIFYASNFSIGIALFQQFLSQNAPFLTSHFSLALSETHHTEKKDSPSGTALALASPFDQIDIDSMRIAEKVGIHSLTASSPFESLTITHEAKSRTLFAQGALDAAVFIQNKPPKLYAMSDLLNANP
ncbi:MAG: 4-hydroxy-tetrahydrodipicolinate reductase [Chlamydiia bacterium]|nr:4-hydroxy-tetrahydrodipicolinate reductase [Chlamydiia bacterium]